MKYLRSDLLKKSLITAFLLGVLSVNANVFAQGDSSSAGSDVNAAYEAEIKRITGLPFPFFIAVVFIPTGIGIFVLCMSADRRERYKEEVYVPTRLGEAMEGNQQAPQMGLQARSMGGRPCEEAKTALKLGVIGLVLFPPLGIAAIIVGFKAKKIIASDRRLTGEGNALAGIILGFAALGLWGLGLLLALTGIL